MRRILAAALLAAPVALTAASAVAQNTTVVVEPVPSADTSVISAPIQYDDNGVAKAQYFKAEDLSPEQLAALYAEADRVRSYQQSNGIYVRPETAAAPGVYQQAYDSSVAGDAPLEIQLYADPIPQHDAAVPPLVSPYESAARTPATVHTVSKGDTLYNISKRYNVSVTALQQANGIGGSAISLGQQITIPVATLKPLALNTVAPTVTLAQSETVSEGYVTRRVVEPLQAAAPVRAVTSATDTVYAVLPKDTLYAISRRTCTKVPALIASNGISNANALKPGQRLTIPAGHCLTQ